MLGIIGADSLIGSELLSACEDAGIRDVKCFDEDSKQELESSYFGESLVIEELNSSNLGKCKIILLCCSEISQNALDIILNTDCQILDLVGLVPNIKPYHPYLSGVIDPGSKLIRIPTTNAAHLVLLLDEIIKNSTNNLASVLITTLEPVASAGLLAVDELWQQGLAVYNQKSVETDFFQSQIAFNCLPFGGEDSAQNSSTSEALVATEIEALLNINPDLVAVRMARAPIFYGTIHSVTLLFKQSVSLDLITEHFKNSQFVRFDDSNLVTSSPMELEDRSLIDVTQLRSLSSGVSFWAVADNIHFRINMAVDVCKTLLKEFN